MTDMIRERIIQIQSGSIPNGYKKTRAATIPEEWRELHLKDMFIHLRRKNSEGNTNVLTISARHGLISQDDFFNKNIASEDTSTYYLLQRGDFAYNKSYSSGYPFGAIKPLVAYDSGIVSPLYICFSATEENECPCFFAHYFEAGLMNREIQAFAQEGARNHGLLNIAVDDFFNSIIFVPSIEEQKKITDILDAQDELVSAKEQLLSEMLQRKKYLTQSLLSGQKRLPNFSEKWSECALGEIAKKSRAKNADFLITQVFSNSAQNGVVPQEEQFDKEIAHAERIDGYYIIKPGEFVYNPRISVTAPCGPINRNDTGEKGVMSPLYTVFTINSPKIDSDFLSYYFKSTCWYRYMKSVANYGARHDRMNVSDEDFFAMPIPLPNVTEQQAIASVLSAVDDEIVTFEKELQQEKDKRRALMQLLLTGIVRTKA